MGSSDGKPGSRTVALVGFPPPFAESFPALAEIEGWNAIQKAADVRPSELARLRLRAAVLDAESLGARLWSHLAEIDGRPDDVGLIVLASRSTRRDRVLALRGGVDFWAPRSVDPVELMAMVVVSTRSSRRQPLLRGSFAAGDLRFRAGRVLLPEGELVLPRRELILLNFLASNQGQMLGREEIHDAVWGGTMTAAGRCVDVVVAKLRRKLERWSPDYEYIHTHYRIGYRFEPVPVESVRLDPAALGTPLRAPEPA